MYRPMRASPGDRGDRERPDPQFEPKLDGTRALCYVNSDMHFINRRDHDISERYPEFSFRRNIKASSCVLDGEIVVYDAKGNPSFSLLQRREQTQTTRAGKLSLLHPATYVVFDVLELEGKDLTPLKLEERRGILRSILEDGERVQLIVATEDGAKLWGIVENRELEGVIAKRADSPYEPGRRSRSWIKIKTTRTVDCVIIGFTSEKRAVSALALGLYFGQELRYIGRVGTGFTETFLERLRPVLDERVVQEPPVSNYPQYPIIWVRPEMVAEIEYLRVTKNWHLRAPSFHRLRLDKDPKECTSEELKS